MSSIHPSRFTKLAAITAVTVSAGALATPALAQAAPQHGQRVAAATATRSGIVTHANTLTPAVTRLMKGTGLKAQRQALTSYWTPARMKAAKPVEQSASFQQRLRASLSSAKTAKALPRGRAGGVGPSKTATAPKAIASPSTIRTQSWYPNLPYWYPAARTQGKVFFTRSGVNYVCSATVVNSEGKSLVWTAGHCVADAGVWDRNFAFVPSYNNGSRPYGTWYSRQLTTTSAWFYSGDFRQDNGAATMYRNFGYRIADYLGGQGLMWNQSANYYAYGFGYPQAYPYNGAYLTEVYGYTYSHSDGSIYMYSGLTGGSSGGAWLRSFNGNWGYVNGHNDYIYTNAPSYMHSPYYGNQVASLYNAVRYATS